MPVLRPENIPAELRARAQWVAWRYESRDGRRTKVPYGPRAARASVSDPSTWLSFDDALALREGSGMDGVGFVLTEDDPYCAFDLDHCLGEPPDPECARIVETLASYAEITPSGEGLRVVVRATLPPGGRKRGKIECYDRLRYVTVTGDVYGAPLPVAARQEEVAALHAALFPAPPPRARRAAGAEQMALTDRQIVDRARAAANGGKFGSLWDGDWRGAGYPSQSEADSALCCLLAFWSGADPARVDALFRQSGLMRPKWDRPHYQGGATYGERAVARACDLSGETYRPAGREARFAVRADDPVVLDIAEIAPDGAEAPRAPGRDPDGGEWEPIVPLGAHDLPPFPVATLPGWLAAMVEAVAEQTQTPPDLAGMMVLSACAAALAKRYEIEAKPGWREPLNIYTATVLSPGNRKSAVCHAIVRPMESYARAESERLAPEIARAQSEKRVLEARQRDVERRAAAAGGDSYHDLLREARDLSVDVAAVPEPGDYRLFTEDCTPEKLTGLLADNEGRMAVLSAEGDTFDIIAGRYSQNANLGVYLKSHSGETLIVDRVGRKGEHVPAPALTIGMAIQPDVLRGLLTRPTLRGRGLLGRFLYSLPPDRLGYRCTHPAPVPAAVAETYAQGMLFLLGLTPRIDGSGQRAPRLLRPDESAAGLLEAYETSVEEQLRPGAEMGDMTDWGGKLVGAVARLAALLHIAAHAVPARDIDPEVHAPTLLDAIHLGNYLAAHARAAFTEMGTDTDLENARLILEWIRRRSLTEFSQRDVYRQMARRFKKTEEIVAPLLLLAARGFVREIAPTEEERRHNAKARYIVNPAVREMPG